jgi:hypothetical protein
MVIALPVWIWGYSSGKLGGIMALTIKQQRLLQWFMAITFIGVNGYSHQVLAIDSAVKQQKGPIWVAIPDAGSKLQTIKFTTPAKGYVTITATGTISYGHSLGVESSYCLNLHNTANYVGGCAPEEGSNTATRSYIPAGFPTTVPGVGFGVPYTLVRIWPVAAKKSYAFYLNGYATNLNNPNLLHPTLTAIYTPALLK